MARRDCVASVTVEPLTEDEKERTLRVEFSYEEWQDFKGYYGMAPAYQTEGEVSGDCYYLDDTEISYEDLQALLGPERARGLVDKAIEIGIERSV